MEKYNHNKGVLPHHVAIIMDGNGRWATARGLDRIIGHQQGSKTAEEIIKYAHELKIPYITLYAFSMENWRRPKAEVAGVFKVLETYLQNDPNELIKNGIRIVAIGDLQRLPQSLREKLQRIIEKTKDLTTLTICLALSYSSTWEIAEATKEIARRCHNNEMTLDDINEAVVTKSLKTKDIPFPDLFIRTSGELRLSNFLLFQLSYSELYFTKKLWPDFQQADFNSALDSFAKRHRRFGA